MPDSRPQGEPDSRPLGDLPGDDQDAIRDALAAAIGVTREEFDRINAADQAEGHGDVTVYRW